jgi:subtilisin family serine protease
LIAFSTSLSAWIVQAQIIVSENDGIPAAERGMALDARFDGQDRLRVIVQLKVPGQEKSAELMTPAIHQAQRELIGEVKSGEVRVIHEYDYIPFMALEVNRAGFEALQKNPNVIGIEEDVLMKPMLQESVPLINADDVWLEGVTGAGQVVAILDTGVDKNHPALAGKVVSEACYSTTNVFDGSTSLCPGGASASIATNSALPYETVCPAGDCDHGTHVAGIVAADGLLYGNPIKGVAPDAQIIAIQVFSRFDSPSQCYPSPSPCVMSYTSDQLAGLQRVYELRNSYSIAAVNLSLGGGLFDNQSTCDMENSSYKAKVDLLKSVGIATIAASGNSSSTDSISSPACISSVISVGATTESDYVAYYSNSASFLDLLAPGSSITSAVPGTGYATWNGTSMATPHVAGAWALMKSFNPDLSVDYLLNVFEATGKPILDLRNSITKPRIDVFASYNLIKLFEPITVNASDGDHVGYVSLTWGEQSNVSYQVYRNPENSPETATILVSGLTSNSYNDSTANPGTIYYYWVKACYSISCSDFSEPDSGWRGYQTIPSPEGVSASDGEFTDKVQISWYEVGGATKYKIFRHTSDSFMNAELLAEQTTILYDDFTASNNTNYYYWVQACNGDECSDYSISDIGYITNIHNIYLPLISKNGTTTTDPIKNGNFEGGQDGSWLEFSSNGYELILLQEELIVIPQSGTWAVWLGGDFYETSRLSQNVTISLSLPYLHFWYWIGSEDYCGYDYFNVKVNNVIINTINLCGVNNSTNWGEKVINLSAYSGSNINLMFEVVTDGTFNSNLFLDNVSMSASSSVASSLFTSQISTEDYSKSRK